MMLLTVFVYFALLMLVSRLTSRRSDNDAFYRGNRHSPWYVVAFGMIGASISGITFVSVPGMVANADMTYMQTCLGFILGYFAVAFILLPVYYKHNLTTIYSFLQKRLGNRSYRTGATFFLLSKMTGAAARFYVVCFILHRFVFADMGVPFALTAVAMVALIWLYTRRSGIKTLVWTDSLQTLCMFAALVLIIYNVVDDMGMSVGEAVRAIVADSHSRMFVFDDWMSRQNFWKQFLSGIFIVIVMTGLDQDMMQKNLTCKSLADAKKDMCTYGFAFVPANLLFLALGVLLMMMLGRYGMQMPAKGDDLLPMFAASGMLGNGVVVLFTIGIVAASFSSADSALTAMTTSFCVDMCGKPDDERLRKRVHVCMAVVFILCVLLFELVNSQSVLDAIYTLCGYTYGPLLGLFAYALITKRGVNDRVVPAIAVASPVICFAADWLTSHYTSYRFGYELLMLNGLLTFIGLWATSLKAGKTGEDYS
ncbi:MAG: sodium:solute symporter [Prevotella sp.]|uniref:sodium:solute symporter n=1 Tax=Prevotella sp. P3-122 TaxID=2024223 RepID=UPI000B96370F|nr:sodium:solute symporter [Prevotella sp. P3-122]MCI6181517.1 sodium:solute symporter [Prevotella sp.]MDY3271308.1 sodium:solute symporter [Prevotella sp.]OYP59052.1 sodium:solute symporter [Prevotella sp. P3-122]